MSKNHQKSDGMSNVMSPVKDMSNAKNHQKSDVMSNVRKSPEIGCHVKCHVTCQRHVKCPKSPESALLQLLP